LRKGGIPVSIAFAAVLKVAGTTPETIPKQLTSVRCLIPEEEAAMTRYASVGEVLADGDQAVPW
jgi:hypothetical protein